MWGLSMQSVNAKKRQVFLFTWLVLGIWGGNGNQPESKRNGKGFDWLVYVSYMSDSSV